MYKTLLASLLACAFAVPVAAAPLDANQAQARDIFSHLIAFRTEIGQGQVPVMARYLADQFRAAGFADADIAARLGLVRPDQDLAGAAGIGGLGARLEYPHAPQPFVQTAVIGESGSGLGHAWRSGMGSIRTVKRQDAKALSSIFRPDDRCWPLRLGGFAL